MREIILISILILMVAMLSSETMTIYFGNGNTVEFDTSEILEITFENVSVEEMVEIISKIPIKFLKNSPNPFNPATAISFEIAESGKVKVEIFNIKGQKVKTLLNEPLEIGNHSVVWDGRNDNKKQVSSGMYFYRVSINNAQKVNKMIMLK